MLFNRNLLSRCHKTSLGAFISCIAGSALTDIFNRDSNIEARYVGRQPLKSIIAILL